MNISVLESILTTDHEYWLVNIKNERRGVMPVEFTPSIMMIAIPQEIPRNLKRDEIKLVDLEKLQKIYIDTNIFLNTDTAPFQLYQNLYNVTYAFPIPSNQKEFLKKALELESDDVFEYAKLISE